MEIRPHSKKHDSATQTSPQTSATGRIFVYSVVASFSVLAVALVMQWLIYRDWMHEAGPLRIVGTSIAALVTFAFVLNWQLGLRQRQLETLLRFRRIAEMNDRIRNALQAIECLVFVSDRQAIEGIREAVNRIEAELTGVVEETRPLPAGTVAGKRSAAAGIDADERSA
jgi:hypothetical protein